MRLLTRLPLAFAALLMASAMPLEGQSDAAGRTLSPGDQVRIAVWRKPDMSCDCVVAGNGTVIHPLYREVQVVGVPLSVVEERMRVFLAKYEANPQFVIQPLVKIIVRGEVRAPNIYPVPPETTIAQAIALAGGPTDRGKLSDVRIIRERQEIKVDISRPDSDAGFLEIRSGDQIIVGRPGKSPFEYIAPVFSTVAALAAITNIFVR